MSAQRTIDEDCPPNGSAPHVCPPDYEADALAARRNRDLGLALGLGGAGAIALGVAIFGLTTAASGHDAKDSASSRPRVSVGLGGVTLGGRF